MSGPQHRTREYLAARKALAPVVAAGQAWCVEPRCLVAERGGSRWIHPDTPSNRWHVSHNEAGTVILGPSHRRCNLSEAARRGNRARAKRRRRWVIVTG